MPTICYCILNVFAKSTFNGNPLIVVEDASVLSSAGMQLIARHFNLSETSFVLPSAHAPACHPTWNDTCTLQK